MSSTWSPYIDWDVSRLEQVQKNSACFVTNTDPTAVLLASYPRSTGPPPNPTPLGTSSSVLQNLSQTSQYYFLSLLMSKKIPIQQEAVLTNTGSYRVTCSLHLLFLPSYSKDLELTTCFCCLCQLHIRIAFS